ncbi:MAG: hypothetical protein JTJ29_14830, partial [Bifidobacterium sp.]|nr:hypothetical protein [Bifidobacterium sp.]
PTAPSKSNSAKRASPKCSNWSARKPHGLSRIQQQQQRFCQNHDVHRLMCPIPAESLFRHVFISRFDMFSFLTLT